MTMKRWDGASFVDTSTEKRWDGVSWVDLTVAKKWDGVAWVDIAFPGGGGSSLRATADKSLVSGSSESTEPAPLFALVTSEAVTITALGGMGAGPTYSWTRVSGDSVVSVDSPTAATTTFSGNIGKNQFKSAVYRCTIIRGAETVTVDVNVALEYAVEP